MTGMKYITRPHATCDSAQRLEQGAKAADFDFGFRSYAVRVLGSRAASSLMNSYPLVVTVPTDTEGGSF